MLCGSSASLLLSHDLEVGELRDEPEEQHDDRDADAADADVHRSAPGAARCARRVVGDAQQDREQREVGDERRSAVRDERQRDAGERDHAGDAADDEERLEAEDRRDAGGEQLARTGAPRRPRSGTRCRRAA